MFAKCLQPLTLSAEADVVKMEVINALDSSSVQPKRRRVRKPAASKDTKPPGEEQKLIEEKNTSSPPQISSPPKKSRTNTPAAVKPPANPNQEESSNSVKGQPASSTVSTLEQNSYGVSLSEESTKGATPEPKKSKKKRKEVNEDKYREEEIKKGGETIGQASCKKPFEETNKANGERKQSDDTKHQTIIVPHDEVPDSVAPEEKREKKAKRKKKERSEQEEDQVSSEQLSEMTSEGPDQIVSAKKKKKKSKTNVENSEATLEEAEGIPVEIPHENSYMVDKESETALSEHVLKKKKRKKDKADRRMPELADKDRSEIADVNGNDHNESTCNDPALLPQLSPVTPQTEKKKSEYMNLFLPTACSFQSQFLTRLLVLVLSSEKSKLQSADAPATPQTSGPDSQDTSCPEELFQPLSVIHKKVSDVTVVQRYSLNFCYIDFDPIHFLFPSAEKKTQENEF